MHVVNKYEVPVQNRNSIISTRMHYSIWMEVDIQGAHILLSILAESKTPAMYRFLLDTYRLSKNILYWLQNMFFSEIVSLLEIVQ